MVRIEKFKLWHAGVAAILVFMALFGFRLWVLSNGATPADGSRRLAVEFETKQRNYASVKFKGEAPAAPAVPAGIGLQQKYERIASVGAASSSFEQDRQKANDEIKTHAALVQFEMMSGLPGNRDLQLGIGVPPDRFDELLSAMRAIGTTTSFNVVRNDKTNEYLRLRAHRASLEAARTQLQKLQAAGGSIDERLNLQNRLSEIEEKMQELGVSLGDFDSNNEFVTIKFGLREKTIARPRAWRFLVLSALEWTAGAYLALGLGFLGIVAGLWICVVLVKFLMSVTRPERPAG
ncbi:MAG: DUF4349 domain-containing protein [Bradyrhizobium sp.]|uniref:DUF4349 domain-containing protein n=1 Tax=Bradyrhizobium sp. TaxID=376 RepID=UPI0025C66FBB|nr:DUF4349 domain-containing protein [Bradyrhizobium sp.]MBI5263522.1 DUF4349 domain-containing protein [Bradyrhizobium sp.]